MRHERSRPLWQELHVWLQLERKRVPDGSAIAKAIDYSLNHWQALSRFLLDGNVPIDNNHIENQMRPWAMGRKAWLFIGSQLAGERAAMVMSLLQSAKLNGRDPYTYLKDVLMRLPMLPNSRLEDLLPHRWRPAVSGKPATSFPAELPLTRIRPSQRRDGGSEHECKAETSECGAVA
jgi:hypothetical protein